MPTLSRSLLPKVGFALTIRIHGLVFMGSFGLANLLIRRRLTSRNVLGGRLNWEVLKPAPLSVYCRPCFVTFLNSHTRLTYVAVSISRIGISTDLSFYPWLSRMRALSLAVMLQGISVVLWLRLGLVHVSLLTDSMFEFDDTSDFNPPILGAILTASGSFNAVVYYAGTMALLGVGLMRLVLRRVVGTHSGCSWGRKVIFKLLRGHPEIQVNWLVDHHGYRSLIRAARGGNSCIVELLLMRRGVQVNLVDNGGSSSLVKAAFRGHKGVAKLFMVQFEIQVNLFDSNGGSALILTGGKGNEGVVELLLGTGVFDVNAVDLDGKTPTMLVAKVGHEATVRLLPNVPNVDVSIRNPIGGHTATSAAQVNSHSAIAKLLQDFEFQRAFITRHP
ncbi:ankyrin repeat-containing domain protein [Coprinopsis sp. MPI-PUGE-AT-0042]|nr:ankyrin repeat-containing domain protein [Coprinopsis sp. MPI-PUGE-AT-0042]